MFLEAGVASFPGRSHLAPAFDCLYYAKNGGESLEEGVACTMSGRHEGRQRGSGAQLRNLEVLLLISCSRT